MNFSSIIDHCTIQEMNTKSKVKSSLINEYGLENSYKYIEDRKKSNPFGEAVFVMRMVQFDGMPAVIEGHEALTIGSIGSAYNRSGLESYGITHILCLTDLSRLKFPELIRYISDILLIIKYLHVPTMNFFIISNQLYIYSEKIFASVRTIQTTLIMFIKINF